MTTTRGPTDRCGMRRSYLGHVNGFSLPMAFMKQWPGALKELKREADAVCFDNTESCVIDAWLWLSSSSDVILSIKCSLAAPLLLVSVALGCFGDVPQVTIQPCWWRPIQQYFHFHMQLMYRHRPGQGGLVQGNNVCTPVSAVIGLQNGTVYRRKPTNAPLSFAFLTLSFSLVHAVPVGQWKPGSAAQRRP